MMDERKLTLKEQHECAEADLLISNSDGSTDWLYRANQLDLVIYADVAHAYIKELEAKVEQLDKSMRYWQHQCEEERRLNHSRFITGSYFPRLSRNRLEE